MLVPDPPMCDFLFLEIKIYAWGDEYDVWGGGGGVYGFGLHPFLGYFGKLGFRVGRIGQNETCAKHSAIQLHMVRHLSILTQYCYYICGLHIYIFIFYATH